MATCPPLLVAPPPTQAAVGGLFAAARFPELPSDGNGNRWECGVQYQADSCASPEGWTFVCPPEVPADKPATLTLPLVEGSPFIALLGIECKLVGNTLDEFERHVVRAYTLCEQRAVEEIFWSGSEGNNSLSRPDALPADRCTVVAGTTVAPLSLTAGVAALEGYLGDNYCGVGVIHAPRDVAAYAAAERQVAGAGAVLTTTLGTRWAFGAGYSVNTGPDGVAAPAGVAWLYATGQVNIWRSEVYVNPDDLRYAFNTRTNDVTIFAERTYAITTECVCAAVPVALPAAAA